MTTSWDADGLHLLLGLAPPQWGTMETIDLDDLVDQLGDRGDPALRLGFVLLWSRDEAHRVGELALIPARLEGRPAVLGRAEPGEADPSKLTWLRQRPGHNDACGGLNSASLSRGQLTITSRGETAKVENCGRGALLHNGAPVESAQVVPGDVLEVSQRLVLLVTLRPAELPDEQGDSAFAFGHPDAHGMVGESAASWRLRQQLGFLARRTDHVLIRGESGTGKELVAQALHAGSTRSAQPLVSRNAATIPETLVDAELFGNTKNYPNPGMPERPGLIGAASGSTLFLDEFAELPLEQQAHLLRVLDSGEYHRLGESRARRADLRLVAATNRPDTAFKTDVLARFKLRLQVPGLDERREDVPLLARQLLRRMATDDTELAELLFPNGEQPTRPLLTPALVTALVRHPYATHVRELETLLWDAIVNRRGDQLDVWAEFPGEGAAAPDPMAPPAVDPNSLDPQAIQACLTKHEGKQEPVWRELGLSSRHVLTRLVRKHGLDVRGRTR